MVQDDGRCTIDHSKFWKLFINYFFNTAQEGTNAFVCWHWNCMQWVLPDSIFIPGIFH